MHCFNHLTGTQWRGWLRHYASNQKVSGLILDCITGIFHFRNPSGCTMVLGLTQPLTEMSTRNIYWGVKAVSTQGWQPYHFYVLTVLKSGNPQGLYRDCFTTPTHLSLFPLGCDCKHVWAQPTFCCCFHICFSNTTDTQTNVSQLVAAALLFARNLQQHLLKHSRI